jgi:transcription elongation factor SPT5
LDIEAEESEDEGEAEGEGTAAGREYYESAVARMRREADEARRRREKEKSAQEIAAEYEARGDEYVHGGDFSALEDQMAGDSATARQYYQQANLPSREDPKLWLIKCKDGAETDIMIALVNKYIAVAESGQPRLAILSAVCPCKGMIFVEAYRDSQVKTAVAGISDLYSWKPGSINMVPLDEMPAVMRVTSERKLYKKGDYVRVTRGPYKGDPARVVDTRDNGKSVLVRLIPRVNFSAFAIPKEKRRGVFGRGPLTGGVGGGRPPPRFFDRAEVESALAQLPAGAEREDLRELAQNSWGLKGVISLGGTMEFLDGFLLKPMRPEYISANGPPLSLEEMTRLNPFGGSGKKAGADGPDGPDAAEDDGLTGSNGSAAPQVLVPNDEVIVVKGDLIGIHGRVAVVNPGNTFTMAVSRESKARFGITEDRLEIELDEVIKTFNVGERVKAISGSFKGETGIVTAISQLQGIADPAKSWMATIHLDSRGASVDVFMRDLMRTAEVAVATATVNGYRLFDHVEVAGGVGGMARTGVIVEVGQTEVTVLLAHNNTRQSVAITALRGRVQKSFRDEAAMDIDSQPIKPGDEVRLVGSVGGDIRMPADTVGTVKYVQGFQAFVLTKNVQAIPVLFVTRGKNLRVLGTQLRPTGASLSTLLGQANPNAPGAPVNINAFAQQGMSAGVGAPPSAGNTRGGPMRGAEDALVGKTVVIIKGLNKGFQGVVRSVTGDNCHVEVHATQKKVPVAVASVRVIGDKSGAIRTAGSAGSTFAIPVSRPAAVAMPSGAAGRMGGATVAYGGATTAYGSATGAYGGATTAYGGATNAYGGASSAYVNSYTPAYGPGAGGVGGYTPYVEGAYGSGGRGVGGITPFGGTTPYSESQYPQAVVEASYGRAVQEQAEAAVQRVNAASLAAANAASSAVADANALSAASSVAASPAPLATQPVAPTQFFQNAAVPWYAPGALVIFTSPGSPYAETGIVDAVDPATGMCTVSRRGQDGQRGAACAVPLSQLQPQPLPQHVDNIHQELLVRLLTRETGHAGAIGRVLQVDPQTVFVRVGEEAIMCGHGDVALIG